MKLDILEKHRATWLTASAVGVLFAAQGAVAAGGDNGYEQKQAGAEKHQQQGAQTKSDSPKFSEVDTDNDGEVQWQDIESEHEQELSQANWDQQEVFSQFDQDNDQSLDEQEYDSFQTALNAQAGAGAGIAAADTGNQTGIERQREPADRTQGQQQAQQGQQAQQQQAQREQQAQQGQQQAQQPGQQGQQAQAGQQAQDIDTTLLTMPVDQVVQADVVNSRGEEIGSVSRIVRDEASGELSLVIESGGVLGLGGSSTLVNLNEVSQMGENQLLWDTMLSQEEIAEMPEFDETQYSEISEEEYATLDEAQRG